MTSDQAFTFGIFSFFIGTVMATVGSWVVGTLFWIAVAIIAAGALIVCFGVVMLWNSWRIYNWSTGRGDKEKNLCMKISVKWQVFGLCLLLANISVIVWLMISNLIQFGEVLQTAGRVASIVFLSVGVPVCIGLYYGNLENRSRRYIVAYTRRTSYKYEKTILFKIIQFYSFPFRLYRQLEQELWNFRNQRKKKKQRR